MTCKPISPLPSKFDGQHLLIRDYSDDLQPCFEAITAEWMVEIGQLSQYDMAVLARPRESIIDPGGAILFVESRTAGIIGTGALLHIGAGLFELARFGVAAAARGAGAGRALALALVNRAPALGAETLYLLTRSHLVPAIHLYESVGFRRSEEALVEYGSRDPRADVAMVYGTGR